jgi:molybdopterin synthase catalytic subunit
LAVSVKVSSRPIRIDAVVRSVQSGKAGGTVVFIGSVRERSHGRKVTSMGLEAAEGLASKDLKRIASEAEDRFGTTKIAVAHRVGRLRVGDTIVVIAVSAPHRRSAFSANRFIIDELKKTTPIWKKEFEGKHGRWVRGNG